MAKLIGTAPNQVPTNADLGSLAYMDKDNFDANITELTLGALSKEITDTAVDIFVYDTRKDSDGGAWRKRTQHTSWYNEEASNTRGSRKEFPAVAVIVAESNQVTIYDGDDPDLPMWMVFNYGTTGSLSTMNMLYAQGTAVTALNGVICTAGDQSWKDGLVEIKLVSDTSFWRNDSNVAYWGLDIASRNVNGGYGSFVTNETEKEIVHASVNDVAMTVLPNAPIDAATGLPVPTIAVSTSGGLSVILDSGSVASLANTGGTTSVDFDSEGKVYASWRNGSSDAVYSWSSETYSSGTISFTNNDLRFNDSSWSGAYQSGGLDIDRVAVAQNDYISFAGNSLIVRDYGLHIHSPYAVPFGALSEGSPKAEWARITSSYNTGWMNGDIKLATLSDTDDTNVTGSELLNQDGTEWSLPTGFSHSSGTLSYDGTGNLYSKSYDRLSGLTVGQTYTVSFNITAISGGSIWVVVHPSGAVTGNHGGVNPTSTGQKSFTFKAETVNDYIVVQNNSSTQTFSITDFSVHLAEDDRSVHDKGLQVFGTVTKSAVATGADLVAYSGFSASNYLEQPYNSDLNFGTGDFCVMGWIKANGSSAHQCVLQRNSATAGAGFLIEYRYDSDSLLLQTDNGSSVSNLFSTSSSIPTGLWVHACAIVTNSGEKPYWYINGVHNNTTDWSGIARNVDNTAAFVRIGEKINESRPLDGYLALWRISATVPTPEQIKKIYEDEKVLFQENAKATLYGTSDSVTALAYDDSTNLLHVGTSAGRSVFQGLRRVDNTTTAVGAAISASNGLVADE